MKNKTNTDLKKQEIKQSTNTSFTLLSQMMGASLLSLPSLVQKIGLVYIIILYVSGVIIQALMYRVLVQAACYTNSRTYRQLVENVLGQANGIVLDIFIMINYYGVTTAYIIIAAQNYISFFEQVADYSLNAYATKAVIAALIFCLCLLKDLKQLGKIASAASLTIFLFAFSIIAYFFIGLKSKQLCPAVDRYELVIFPEQAWYLTFANFVAYIPATSGSFTAHTLIPTILYEMEGPGIIRMKVLNVALLIAMGLALILYLFSGIMGANMFGANQADNILISFQPCKFVWIYIMQFLYGLVVILVYPLVIYPIKVSFSGYLSRFRERNVHIVVSVVIVCLTMILGMFLEKILAIFGFFSAVAGFFIFFYYPLRIYARLEHIRPQYDNIEQPADSLPVVIGSILLPGASSENLQRLRTLSDKSLPPVEASNNAIPLGRRKSFSSMVSISIHSENTDKQNIDVAAEKDNDGLTSLSIDILEEESDIEKPISKRRIVISWALIAVFIVVCLDGAVINFLDILKTFKPSARKQAI